MNDTQPTNRVLSGHVSPETAYVVEDYPYGFRLRCRIRYWLEYKPGKGHRLWSQTSNPKQPGLVWNKPKASTFCRFAGAMVINSDGHVTWTGLTEYDEVAVCVAWRNKYAASMPQAAQDWLKLWITKKLAFEQAKCERQIVSTVTTTRYGCITSPGFGKPIAPPTVTHTVLESKHTPDELAEMGRSLRSPVADQLGKLASSPPAPVCVPSGTRPASLGASNAQASS